MDELFEKVKKIIADKLEVEESKITLDASFRQILAPILSIPTNSCMESKKSLASRFPMKKRMSSKLFAMHTNSSRPRSNNDHFVKARADSLPWLCE